MEGGGHAPSLPEIESGGQFHGPAALYSIEYEGGPHSWPGYSSVKMIRSFFKQIILVVRL
jgi:hypothetical protein